MTATATTETATTETTPTAPATTATAPTASSAPPRWTLARLVRWVRDTFDHTACRETIRRALVRLELSWKKAKKLLSRADPAKRAAFVATIQAALGRALRDQELLVYVDEAHVHQDADLGYGWSVRGERYWVCSSSPGLKAKVSFYGLYVYNEGRVHIWDFERANGEYTVRVLERLRRQYPGRAIRVIWDGAGYHRSAATCAAATRLGITLELLPAYSPDFMPVEALWRWLREDVTYNHCHHTADELRARVQDFERRINESPLVLADRLWVKDELDPEEEKLRIPR